MGGGCPYSEQALRRAVSDRLNYNQLKPIVPLFLMRSTVEFEYAKHCAAANSKPCSSSVVWWAGNQDNNGW